MIHSIKEEVYISIYLVSFGIYIISTYDVFYIVLSYLRINNIIKKIIEVIFCLINIYITYLFSYNLSNGYIPIYFILFFIVGVVIYYKFLSMKLQITINKIMFILRLICRKYCSKFLSVLFPLKICRIIKNKIYRNNIIEIMSVKES